MSIDQFIVSCATDTNTTTIVFYIVLAFLDIATDLASMAPAILSQKLHKLRFHTVIAIPVSILRQVQVPLRTKFFLGLSLCLSAVIGVVVITQVSGLHVPHTSTIDIVWEIFWQFMESCVAIIVVCVAAFRSFFIQHRRNQSPPRSPWYQGVKAFLSNKGSASSSSEEGCELPTIPGGALSGMRTFIEGNGREDKRGSKHVQEQDDDRWPLRIPDATQRITVQHDMSTQWETVNLPPSYAMALNSLMNLYSHPESNR